MPISVGAIFKQQALVQRESVRHRIDAAHLHLNTEHSKKDVGVALGLKAFAALQAEGAMGRFAAENYSVMGYQESGCEAWQATTGPEIVGHLRAAAVDALILAPG